MLALADGASVTGYKERSADFAGTCVGALVGGSEGRWALAFASVGG
jgi:hypothetical protein